MRNSHMADATGRKAWSAPELEQLTVDLRAIAAGKPRTQDGNGINHTS